MLLRDSRTSSANGASGRHERHDSAGMHRGGGRACAAGTINAIDLAAMDAAYTSGTLLEMAVGFERRAKELQAALPSATPMNSQQSDSKRVSHDQAR